MIVGLYSIWILGPRVRGDERIENYTGNGASMLPPVFGVLFDGFAYGMLLFVLSVGLSVTLGLMNFVNLAHCAFAMLGGYVTITLVNEFDWPFLATLPVAFLAAAVVSVVLERTLYRRLYRASDLDQVLLTIGLAFHFRRGRRLHLRHDPAAG